MTFSFSPIVSFRTTALRGFLLAALAMGIAGCSGPKRPKPAELPPLTPQLALKPVWSVQTGPTAASASGQGAFSPAVSAGLVVVASQQGRITGVSLASGTVQWSAELGARIVSGVGTGAGTAEGLFAVVTEPGELVLLDRAGAVRWRAALGGVSLERPVITGGVAIVRLMDNRLTGWDLETGVRRWVIQRSMPPLVLHGESGLRAASPQELESSANLLGPGDLLANLPGGRALWVNAATGAVRAESQVATPRGSNEVERLADLLGAPEVLEDAVCLAVYQNSVTCLAADLSRTLWQQRLGVVVPVAADPRLVVAVDASARVVAFDRAAGGRLWQNERLFLRGLSAPVSFDRAVWVSDYQGYLHGLSREDGALIARSLLPGGKASGPMLATRQGLLVQTQGGYVMLLRP
ncbi:MAG: PQQ-binding-like beta-propeller repeat protein [Burkholderiaceae bacterium]